MRADVVDLALITGACTLAFRFLPLRADLSRMPPDGRLARFLAATGPAAIATLFTTEALPFVDTVLSHQLRLLAGVIAVIAVFGARKSAVLSTLAGAATYGVAYALFPG